MSIDGWTDQQNVAYTHNGVWSTLKKNIVTHATTWMNFEDIMPSEINQPQKDKYYMILFIWDI